MLWYYFRDAVPVDGVDLIEFWDWANEGVDGVLLGIISDLNYELKSCNTV